MGDNPYGRQRRDKRKLRKQMEAYYERLNDDEERNYDNEKDD